MGEIDESVKYDNFTTQSGPKTVARLNPK